MSNLGVCAIEYAGSTDELDPIGGADQILLTGISSGGEILKLLSYVLGRRGGIFKGLSLIPDVLRHAAHRGFRRVQIAGRIDVDPFSHRSIGGFRLVRRHEDRHLAILQASDANALEPARVPLRR